MMHTAVRGTGMVAHRAATAVLVPRYGCTVVGHTAVLVKPRPQPQQRQQVVALDKAMYNLFRLAGDSLHCLALFTLFIKINQYNSVAGAPPPPLPSPFLPVIQF